MLYEGKSFKNHEEGVNTELDMPGRSNPDFHTYKTLCSTFKGYAWILANLLSLIVCPP